MQKQKRSVQGNQQGEGRRGMNTGITRADESMGEKNQGCQRAEIIVRNNRWKGLLERNSAQSLISLISFQSIDLLREKQTKENTQFKKLYIYLFIRLRQVLVSARQLLSCGM